MRYLLGGYYGMRNVGDDALLYVTLAEVARRDHQATFTVISDGRETVPPGTAVQMVSGGRRLEHVRQMLRHDVWLFGGGGLLQDASPRALDYLRRVTRSARVVRALDRSVALVGIGVGPLATQAGRDLAGSLLRLANFVTVRDPESAALARELAPRVRIETASDLAFLFPLPARPVRPSAGARTLGVSLLPHAASLGRDRVDDDRLVRRVGDALAAVLARHPNWTLILFEFLAAATDYGDARILRSVAERLGQDGRVRYRPYAGDLLDLHAELAGCDAVLGMRFHSCLLAHLAGVPCLMIAYHPKNEALAARLRLHADAMIPLAAMPDAGNLAARLSALLTEPAKFRPTVPMPEIIDEARQNFEFFANWLATARGARRQGSRGRDR
jgi:polysaccharide pyruvyl transferase CsaB